MVCKGKLCVIPYLVESTMPGLCISLLGMNEEQKMSMSWMECYRFRVVNLETLPLVAQSYM